MRSCYNRILLRSTFVLLLVVFGGLFFVADALAQESITPPEAFSVDATLSGTDDIRVSIPGTGIAGAIRDACGALPQVTTEPYYMQNVGTITVKNSSAITVRTGSMSLSQVTPGSFGSCGGNSGLRGTFSGVTKTLTNFSQGDYTVFLDICTTQGEECSQRSDTVTVPVPDATITLDFKGSCSGSVSFSPPPKSNGSCSGDCTRAWPLNETVGTQANPSDGCVFDHWVTNSGNSVTENPRDITLNNNKSLEVWFEPAPVNGQCGAAAKNYTYNASFPGGFSYCTAGSASPSTPTNPPQGGSSNWTCTGSGGGTNASCQATRSSAPVSGQCGGAAKAYAWNETFPNGAYCSAGSASPSTPSNPPQGGSSNWTCTGSGGGTNSSCQATRATQPPPSSGTVIINSVSSAGGGVPTTWDLTGPSAQSQITPLASKTYNGLPLGTYQLKPANQDLRACPVGFLCPPAIAPASSQTLTDGGTRTFTVTYTPDPSANPQCSDGVDNADPEDTLADTADPGCHTDGNAGNPASYDPNDNDETNSGGSTECSDGVDNADPEDTLADTADPGCHTDGNAGNPASYDPNDNDETDSGGLSGNPPECSDGVDNTDVEDTIADFPNDPGCSSPNDDDERDGRPECSDGADNDNDLQADFPNDPQCDDDDDDNEGPDPQCSDGIDNDNDGFTDFSGGDPGCSGDQDNSESGQPVFEEF